MSVASAAFAAEHATGPNLCALRIYLEGHNESPELAAATWTEGQIGHVLARLRERAPSQPVALRWLKLWGRAQAYRATAPKVAARLQGLQLQTPEEQILFFLLIPPAERLAFIAGREAGRATAELLTSRIDPDAFFPSIDGSGFRDAAQKVLYDELLEDFAERLGSCGDFWRREFEQWVRHRSRGRRPQLATLLLLYLRCVGVEL